MDDFGSTTTGRLKTTKKNDRISGFSVGSLKGAVTHPSGIDTKIYSPGVGTASIGHGINSPHVIHEIIGEINDVKFTVKEVPFGSVVAFRRTLIVDMDGTGYRVVGVGRRGYPVVEDDSGRRLGSYRRSTFSIEEAESTEEFLLAILLSVSGLADVVRNQEWLPRVGI